MSRIEPSAESRCWVVRLVTDFPSGPAFA